ncbi:MAG TPA: 30S ribosomal protein S6 [Gemmatimonadota bacterium]|nr:30S ribosomal protein S6 [Gemmatimonadota bacterium]
MARIYETVIIFDSSLPDEQIEERIERFKGVLANDGEAPFQIDRWGKRKLAYPIQKKEQGHYAVFRYESQPAALAEFERLARIDEMVLRQLTVVNPVEPRAPDAEPRRRPPSDEDE